MSEDKLQYEPVDKKTGKVICQICGEKFFVISPRHLLKHNIVYSDYKKRYPNAPLSSKAFSAKTRYGKVKDIFSHKEEDYLEEIIVEEEPQIEDKIDIEKILKSTIPTDHVKQSKNKVFDTLKGFFINIRKDYLIEEFGKNSGRLKYSFITDFTDPVLKLIIQFPKAFWHNKEAQIDPMKNEKLKNDGWKVLVVNSKAPTYSDIQNIVDNM